MLIPSYAELMDVLNAESNEKDEITSRYTIVIAAAKRARQLIEGDEPMVNGKKGKPVSTAVEEIYKNKIKVVPEGEGTVLIFKKDVECDDYEKNELDSTNVELKESFNFIDKDDEDNDIISEDILNEDDNDLDFDINDLNDDMLDEGDNDLDFDSLDNDMF